MKQALKFKNNNKILQYHRYSKKMIYYWLIKIKMRLIN